MELAQWKQSGHYFSYLERYPVFYQDSQSSLEPLVLLHGFPTASWDWYKIWPALSGKYRLIAPDFIGFGFSAKPFRYNYSIHDQADLVETLLRRLHLQQVHLLAHDYGDTVAQELLARMYDRAEAGQEGLKIKSCVFLNGGLFPESHQARPIQKALIGPFGLLLTPFLNRNSLEKNFKEIFGPDTQASSKEIDEFYALIQHKRGKFVFHKLIRYMQEREQFRERWVRPLMEKVCRMRLINGPEDPVSGKHLAQKYQDEIPGADVVLLEGIGHYPQTEAPKEVIKQYFEFRDRFFEIY